MDLGNRFLRRRRGAGNDAGMGDDRAGWMALFQTPRRGNGRSLRGAEARDRRWLLRQSCLPGWTPCRRGRRVKICARRLWRQGIGLTDDFRLTAAVEIDRRRERLADQDEMIPRATAQSPSGGRRGRASTRRLRRSSVPWHRRRPAVQRRRCRGGHRLLPDLRHGYAAEEIAGDRTLFHWPSRSRTTSRWSNPAFAALKGPTPGPTGGRHRNGRRDRALSPRECRRLRPFEKEDNAVLIGAGKPIAAGVSRRGRVHLPHAPVGQHGFDASTSRAYAPSGTTSVLGRGFAATCSNRPTTVSSHARLGVDRRVAGSRPPTSSYPPSLLLLRRRNVAQFIVGQLDAHRLRVSGLLRL